MSGETSPAIARYAAPKRPSGVLILVAVFLVLVVGAVVVTTILSPDDDEATALPSVTAKATPTPTPERSGGTWIDQAGVKGYWKVTSTVWQDDTVTVHVAIEVDDGILAYEFYAFDEVSSDVYSPWPGAADSLDSKGFASAGQTLTGSLTFYVRARGDLTLIMSDGEVQLSAVKVAG
jgi:hypothetical protein